MKFKYIDMESWNRKDHFHFFSQFSYPHFNICANLDITNYFKYIKEHDIPFFLSMTYLASKTANGIPEFRQRIREGKVIEHEIVKPAFTVMTESKLFSFCTTDYIDDFSMFKDCAMEAMEKVKNNIIIEDEPGEDDLLYITSIPWISFTSMEHPIQMNPVDSIPRLTWGKYFEENGRMKLPFSVQMHHALADGLHVGEYYNMLQEILEDPDFI
ncbi:chloramphenicol acetyltransferase [Anaerocolumna aminovalerica]|uniref:Chloramphenicol O-acetyltransferase type A n=1 Tax=Anaerocolumna aminovalerica TaxID=1527 RepID=A0A1I5BL73_9FIRM|nr:chloramphenicol acetyltransferase [Anaerocolumna aminovalerica]SFN75376.1 chloramphenicol O-acetyltransferase type A [Anaerocolumna aminovalerica]